jgi:zinc D-Ala-D-Ala carboxypeptidase
VIGVLLAQALAVAAVVTLHVTGIAVDVQPIASAGWVERHGPALGWCRRYDNEYWHFEYDPAYATVGCPALLPSATGA